MNINLLQVGEEGIYSVGTLQRYAGVLGVTFCLVKEKFSHSAKTCLPTHKTSYVTRWPIPLLVVVCWYLTHLPPALLVQKRKKQKENKKKRWSKGYQVTYPHAEALDRCLYVMPSYRIPLVCQLG